MYNGFDMFVDVAFFLAILLIGFVALVGGRWMQRSGPASWARGWRLLRRGCLPRQLRWGNYVILWLTYGLLAGIGLGLGYIVPLQTLPKWFLQRAAGVTVAKYRTRTILVYTMSLI